MLSPGVQVVEKDFTNIVPAVSTTTGAFAGEFRWGPVMSPTLVSSENEVVQRFGAPNDATSMSFFSAANFLSYASSLYLTRVSTAAQANAVSAGTAVAINNIDSYENVHESGNNDAYGPFAAKYPGTLGNSLKVSMADDVSFTNWTYKEQFDGAPAAGELHLIVIDEDGVITGLAGSVLEKFAFLGKASNARRSDGTNAYYKFVINNSSKWIYWMDHPVGADWGTEAGPFDTFSALASTVSTSSGSVSGTTVTINTAAVHGLTTDDTVTVTGVAPAGYNGTYEVTVTDTDTFTYTKAGIKSGSLTLTNGATLNTSGLTVTVLTTGVAHTLATGDSVTISGASVSGYDGTFIVTVVDANTFTYVMTNIANANQLSGTLANGSTLTFGAIATQGTVTVGIPETYSLNGGVDGYGATAGEIQNAYALYNDAERYDISLIVMGKADAPTAAYVINNVAETRKDCVVFISPQDVSTGEILVGTGSTVAEEMVAYRNSLPSTSYAVMDSGFKYQYDRYNDVYRWVPLNADVAGICARTDFTNDPWFSPGGYTRGQVKNIVKLAFNPNLTSRDLLYKSGINPVVSFPGQGTVLFGDKTLLAKPSAFDRINVRRLFIVLEKAIATAAKYQLFEFNDQFTRAQFRSLVEPFLRDVQGRRGIFDFRVICDETNNTGEVIDGNRFVADIFIKPARSINFISLNFIAVRTNVSFEEVGG